MFKNRHSISQFALSLMVFVLALIPRVLDLGRFVTHDEAEFWLDRSQLFLNALQSGNFAQTAISTHPGVTTMWLGMVGILLRRGLLSLGILNGMPFPTMLALMQLPVALVHTIGVLIGYWLLRRLLPPTVAILAAILWATDPFTIGYGRLLHVDMLMGTFATLSVLAAGVFWFTRAHSRPYHWLIVSGFCAGLAILSKSPALVLFPLIGLLALISPSPPHQRTSPEPKPDDSEGRTPLLRLLMSRLYRNPIVNRLWPMMAWGGITMVTMLLFWPAIWAAPARVIEVLRVGVEVEGAQPHMTGNYFLGKEDPAPGPLFYPTTLALRTTPLTLIGLLLLPWAAWPGRRALRDASREVVRYLPVLALLAGFVLFLTAGLSLFPKKFNRYLVPAFPSLDALAAWGLLWGITSIAKPITYRLPSLLSQPQTRAEPWGQWVRGGGGGLMALIAMLNAAWWHPYSICAFNQLLGGAPAGARVFLVGWGEGFDQVASWLNQQPDSTGVLTAAIMMKTLNPYLNYGVHAATPRRSTFSEKTGYVVVYIYQTQGRVFPPFDQYYRRVTPLHTVTIHGVEYAWIYQVPPKVAHEVSAQFGSSLLLRGFTLEQEPERGKPLTFSLFWKVIAPIPPDQELWMFAHLIGPDGHRYAQGDWPAPDSTNQVGRYLTTRLQLDIPPDGKTDCQLLIGLYDQKNGQRLPLSGGIPANPAVAGPDALILTTIHIP